VGATDVVNYNWDAEENIWVKNAVAGSGATNTDALPEGTANLYFTTARVLSTLLSGLSLLTGGAIVSTDSVLVALGKLQKQISDNLTAIGLKQNTLVSGNNIKTINGTSILGSGNLVVASSNNNFVLKYFKNYFTDSNGFTATGFTPTFSDGKMRFTGAAGDFSKYITINNSKNTDENLEIEVVFKVVVVGYGVSVGRKSINSWYSASAICHLDIQSSILKIWDGQGTGAGNTISSKTIPTINANDIVKLKYTQLANNIVLTYSNLTQGTSYQLSILGNLSTTKNFKIPNSSEICVFNNSGTNDIISIKHNSFSNYSPDILCVGDSKTVGYSAKSNSLRWGNNINSLGTVIVNAGDGDRTVETVQTIDNTKLIKAKYAILCIGRNDLGSGVSSATWQANYQNIVTQLQGQGTTVFHLLPIPETTLADQSVLKNWIISTYGSGVSIDPSVGWSNATMLSSDGVHPNEVGHAYIARKIIDSGLITPSSPVAFFPKNNEIESVGSGGPVNSTNYIPYSDGSTLQSSTIYRASLGRYGQGTASPYNYGAGWETYEIAGANYGLMSVGKIGGAYRFYISSDGNSAFIGGNNSGVYKTNIHLRNNGALLIATEDNAYAEANYSPSAKLQLDTTTQGFLPPRMTNAHRIAIISPAIGLMVYCTDTTEGLYVYKSTGWTFII
jgi:lysophospholipase L1-like esterase